jgi:hypothetical protein
MNAVFLVQSMYERNHKKSWWDLSRDERDEYYKKNFTRAMMNHYKDTGFVNMQIICSAKQKTKFESQQYRVEHFGAYLRNNGYKCITFPYSNKNIADTTFCVEVPYDKFEGFKRVLSYYELTDYNFV